MAMTTQLSLYNDIWNWWAVGAIALAVVIAAGVWRLFCLLLWMGMDLPVSGDRRKTYNGWQRLLRRVKLATAEEMNQWLLQPRFDDLEEFYRAKVPQTLRRLYTDHNLLRREDFYFLHSKDQPGPKDDHILRFLPADIASVQTFCNSASRTFPFAMDGTGSTYFVELSDDSDKDPPVWLQADSERWIVCDRLSEFISRPIRSIEHTIEQNIDR